VWAYFLFKLKVTNVNLQKQQGFTLIELVMVIVILGILAATALPKFANLGGQARLAAVNGIAGGISSAVAITKAAYLANGSTTATSVTLSGGSIVTVAAGTGIPVGSDVGIGRAMDNLNAVTPDYTTATAVTFTPVNGGSATCRVEYNGTTGVATPVIGGC